MPNGKPKTLEEVLRELREGGQIVPSPAPPYPAPTPAPEAPPPKEGWWDWLGRQAPWTRIATFLYERDKRLKAAGLTEQWAEFQTKPWTEETAREYGEFQTQVAEYPAGGIPPTPTKQAYKEFQELPFLSQLKYESPFWATAIVASMAAPSATVLQTRLASIITKGGKAAIPAKITAKAILPMAKLEQVQARGLLKATNLLKRLNFTRHFKASPSYKTFVKAKPKLVAEGIPAGEIAQIERQLRRALLAELDGNKVAAQQIRLLLTQQYPMLVLEPTVVPKPWLVMGGTGISTMTAEKWGVMTVPQRSILFEALGLAKPTAGLAWAALPAATRAVLAGIPEPEVAPEAPPLVKTPTTPKGRPFMPAREIERILGRELEVGEDLGFASDQAYDKLYEEEGVAPPVPPRPPVPGVPGMEVPEELPDAWNEVLIELDTLGRGQVISDAKLDFLATMLEGIGISTGRLQKLFAGGLNAREAANVIAIEVKNEIRKLREVIPLEKLPKPIEGLDEDLYEIQADITKKLYTAFIGKGVVPPYITKRGPQTAENPLGLELGKPTLAELLTSQNYYARILGAKPLVAPLEVSSAKSVLVRQAMERAVSRKIVELRKVGGKEAPKEMAILLDKFEEAPADLPEKQKELFNWFRNLTRTMWEAENQVRALLGMEQIEYHEAYIRHTIDGMAERILDGRQELPPALQHWMKKIVAQQKFNPMALQRELAVDLEDYFSKDLKYLLTSMVRIGLDEIYLTRPLKIFREQVNELLAAGIMPAETMEWITNYININIMMQQSGLDKRINETFKKIGMAGIINDLLKPFGKSLGAKPFSRLANVMGRMVIAGAMGPRPKLIIRNLFQILQSTGINGFEAVLKSQMPAPPLAQELINESLFFALYTGFEELPVELQKKFERAWLYLYGKSAVFNARQAMKAAYWDYIKYFRQKKYKDLNWASEFRTYKEPNDFLYPSERKLLLELMEQAAAVTQYQYTTMGMPGIFRNKALIPFTRLQSWWMNHFFKFTREMFHQFITGEVGYGITAGGKIPPPPGVPPEERPLYEEPERHPKLPIRARLNLLKYYIFIGAVFTAMGYNRSFLFGVLPGRLAPQASVALDLYNYVSADTEQQRKQAENRLLNDSQVLVPGMLAAKDFMAFWKEGKDVLPETFFYSEEWPPGWPTWSIPQLEAFEKMRESQAKLGTTVPAKKEGEPDEIYQMPDFRGDVRRAVGESGIVLYPMAERSKSHQTAVTIANAELLWRTYYDILPVDERTNFRKQATIQSAVTEAYLFMFGRVSTLHCPDGKGTWSWSAIHDIMEKYDIPKEAIPNYDAMVQRQRAITWEPERAVAPVPETITPKLPEGASLEDVLKALRGEQ